MENLERRLSPKFISLHNNAVYTVAESETFGLDTGALFGEINRVYGKHLTQPKSFDEYSYLIFKKIAEAVPEHKSRIEFTENVGDEIYKKIEILKNIHHSGDPDDIRGWVKMLYEVGGYFREVGYVTGFGFRFDGIFNEDKWKKQGEGNFIYTMKDPVILESAKRLFQEEGFAQHTSSRTIQAGFKRYNIEGSETKDFDPTKFKLEPVEELWEIRKIRTEK